MKKTHVMMLSLVVLVTVFAMLFVACSDKPTNSVPADGSNVVLNPKLSTPVLSQAIGFFRLTVTGRDISPIVTELSFDGNMITGEIAVPVGGERVFILEAVEGSLIGTADETVLYRGVTRATVVPNVVLELDISLEPAVPMVRLTPRMVESESGESFLLDLSVHNIPDLSGLSVLLSGYDDGIVPVSATANPALGPNIAFSANPIYLDTSLSLYELHVASSVDGTIVDANGDGVLATIEFRSSLFTGLTDVEFVHFVSVEGFAPDGAELPVDTIFSDFATALILPLTNSVVTFPDLGLETMVRDVLKRPTGDILVSDAIGITYLNGGDGYDVKDLTGIGQLGNLRYFTLDYQDTLDLAPMADLHYLTQLQMSYCYISDVAPLAGLTDIIDLNLADNNIGNIQPLAGMTKMFRLNIQGNPEDASYTHISNISALTNMSELWYVDLSWNDIVDITPLANKEDLNRLDLSYNQVADISVLANATNLHYVDLAGNNVTDISAFVENSGIGLNDTLVLWGNPLDTISERYHIPELTQNRGVTVYYFF